MNNKWRSKVNINKTYNFRKKSRNKRAVRKRTTVFSWTVFCESVF